MEKQVKCCDCGQERVLEFPDEFEGRPLSSYEQIRSYTDFMRFIKNDYSLGHFIWCKGEEVWICEDCYSRTPWYASGEDKCQH